MSKTNVIASHLSQLRIDKNRKHSIPRMTNITSYFSQLIHLLSNSNINLPSDIHAPRITKNLCQERVS